MAIAIILIFLFAFGACIGSFLNVVVWRLPEGGLKSLASPPSHCPKCQHRLAAYDNIPVFGWIFLRGRCRYCKAKISPRYPIVEALTGGLFVFYFLMLDIGPCGVQMRMSDAPNWPIYALTMFLICSLLAISLIDADLFIIPLEIPWIMAGVGAIAHPLMTALHVSGTLQLWFNPTPAAMTIGGVLGWGISLLALWRGWIKQSFAEGEPLLDHERKAMEEAKAIETKETKNTGGDKPDDEPLPPEFMPAQIRAEMRTEMVFLLPPLLLAFGLGVLSLRWPPATLFFEKLLLIGWLRSFLGSALGAMVGALVVWLTRIFGSYAFGREAMGMGDVHLMFGVGAIIGAAGATFAFFIAPFFGIVIALYRLATGKGRELPFGPYLSLGAAVVVLFYCPIEAYIYSPGMQMLAAQIQHALMR